MLSVLHPKYMLAPLVDKRNLITIILVAVFFGFYRLAGGKVYVTPPVPKIKTKTTVEQLIKDDFPDVGSLSPSADIKKLSDNAKPAEGSKQNLFDDIFGKSRSQDSDSEEQPAAEPVKKDSKLSEIERTLGLK